MVRESESSAQAPSGDGAPWWHIESPDADVPNPVDVSATAQEAVRMFGVLAQWAEQSGLTETLKGIAEQTVSGVKTAAATAATAVVPDVADTHRESADDERADAAGSDSNRPTTCETCPVCQGLDVVKTMSPETAENLNDALALVTTAVKQAIDNFARSNDDQGTDSGAANEASPDVASSPSSKFTEAPVPTKKAKVEHIDID